MGVCRCSGVPANSQISPRALLWIEVNEDYETWNAASQVTEPSSIFNYWAKILKLRKAWVDVFVYGSFELVGKDHDELFVYVRAGLW